MLRVMQMHRDAVEEINAACPAYLQGRGPPTCGTKCSPPGRSARLPQRAGHRARPDRHDQLHDGLRHDRHRAGHRPGEVQAARRRRHAEDRQPDRAAGARARSATTSRRSSSILAYIDEHDTIEGAPDLKDEHLAVFDCAFKPRNGKRSDRLAGPRADDGRRPAVPLGRDLEDGQHAARHHARGHRQGVLRRLEAGPQGPGHLSRRLEGKPAAQHELRRRQGGGRSGRRRQAAPRTAARHAASRSRTSSTSPATKATSPSACSPTAGPASCSSRWPRKAARSAA